MEATNGPERTSPIGTGFCVVELAGAATVGVPQIDVFGFEASEPKALKGEGEAGVAEPPNEKDDVAVFEKPNKGLEGKFEPPKGAGVLVKPGELPAAKEGFGTEDAGTEAFVLPKGSEAFDAVGG